MSAFASQPGSSSDDGGVDAFAEAASRAQLGLGGAPADLVVVFARRREPRQTSRTGSPRSRRASDRGR